MTSRAEAATDSSIAARAAAIASVGAAVVHVAVMPTHWRDWLPSGVFFVSIAMFQLIWAVLAWNRPPASLLAAGIVANAGVAAMWIYSRTAGAPVGPNAAVPEAARAAGICALLLECYIVMGAAWAWMRMGERSEPVSGWKGTLVLLGANSVVGAAVTVGLASGLQGHDHHRPAPLQANPGSQGPIAEHPDADSGRVTKLNAGTDQAPSDLPPAEPVLAPADSPVNHGDHPMTPGDQQDTVR